MKFNIENGVLISAESKLRLTINVPDTVTEIAAEAFKNCKSAQAIVLPESVKKIGYYGLELGRNILEVNIPASVTEISDKMVYYPPKKLTWAEGDFTIEPLRGGGHIILSDNYIDDLPSPIDAKEYRQFFAKRPYIKRIFAYSDVHTLTALSVEEFLGAVEEFCAHGKLYVRETGAQGTELQGAVSPERLVIKDGKYFGIRYTYTSIDYHEMSSGDWGTFWNKIEKILKPEAGKATNRYDEWDGRVEGTIELLEKID